jgi:lipid II:glycine glycyltransferase (peptidoglycan interpeptide bridge formation enzyme)
MRVNRIEINWHPGLSIYASEPFLKSVGDEYGWLGGIDEIGSLRCILPYTVIRKAIFRMVRFRVETIPEGGGLALEEEKSFLNSSISYFRSIGADMIIPATTNTIFRTYPDGADAAPYGSYVIDLTQPEETLWSNLHSKHRNVIRNAIKKGVKIRNGIEDCRIAHELIQSTLKRSKLGFMNFNEFKRTVTDLGENIKIFIAEYDGAANGCAVIPFSGHSAYYLYGGSILQPLTGATNLLQWEAIRQFRNLGVKNYDFVGVRINPEKGSKQDGLMMFKERFGGKLINGYIWKYPITPIKYFLYRFAVRTIRGGDIVDSERHKLHVL